ncbi:UNVERIFIED_CONTAM: hypothetical protein Sradi_5816900 [Sesamum radiatum]|uniref:Reverse transcriptase domain-containing protein n=1 Tax=Sesamum radiatum TaxID=300843 RepID=A0AAW2KPE8_SESRA
MRYQPPPSPVQAAPQTPNSGMSLEDIVKSLALTTLQFQQDTMAGFKSLGNQISQLATSISKLEAQASQQTEANPENVSAMTPQSREELHMIEQAPADTSEDEKTLEYTEVQNEKVESNLISPPSSNTCALSSLAVCPNQRRMRRKPTTSHTGPKSLALPPPISLFRCNETLSHIIFQGLVKEQNVLKLDGREVLRNCKEKTRRFCDFVILKKLFEVGKKVLFYKVRLKPISGKLSSSWLGRFEAVNVFPHGVARIKSLATRQIFKVKGHRSKSFLGGDEVTTISNKALASLQQLTH